MCGVCWRHVPKAIRDRVWSEFLAQPKSVEHLAAIDDAIAWAESGVGRERQEARS